MYSLLFKRMLDFVVAVFGLIILSPILICCTISLMIANRGKPFFLQERPGKNGVIFRIIKFKTMHDGKDKHGNLLPDSARITKIGLLIRKSSIDEIPQLINVLKGDMSVVGPRPLLVQYIPLYNDWQRQRHDVRPGITGWAQVNGRNAISWNQKFKLDVYYVKNVSFYLDMQIVFKTVRKVIFKEGISSEGQATTMFFKGTDEE